MTSQRKNRNAFRPTLGDIALEDRVVLSQTSVMRGQIAAAAQSTNNGDLTARQLINAYAVENRDAYSALHQAITQQVAALYANGRPTAQQLSDFRDSVAGQINAVTLRVASQEALLPNSAKRLVPNLENSLLGQRNSVLSRIQNITSSNRMTRTAGTLQNALTREVTTAFMNNRNQLGNFLNNTNFARASVDQNGNRIPLQQFMAQQIANQFGGTLNGLSQGFTNVANTSLFANGVTNPTPEAIQAFQSQFGQGVNLAAFQLANNLNLLRGTGVTSSLIPSIQSSLFGTSGTGNGTSGFNGLLSAVQNLPFNNGMGMDFTNGVQNAFNNTFTGVINPLNTAFNLPALTTTTPTLPSFSNPFSPTFTNSNFFQGFNSGYGSGFPGFGTQTTVGPNNFGQNFNNFVTTANSGFGFTTPTFASGTGTGLGGGNGFGGGGGSGLGTGFGGGTGTTF